MAHILQAIVVWPGLPAAWLWLQRRRKTTFVFQQEGKCIKSISVSIGAQGDSISWDVANLTTPGRKAVRSQAGDGIHSERGLVQGVGIHHGCFECQRASSRWQRRLFVQSSA